MRILILGIVLFVTGCGFKAKVPDYVDPEFRPYVNDYLIDKERYTGRYGLDRNINVVFKPLNENGSAKRLLGQCLMWSDNRKRYIHIDPIYWYKILGEAGKEALIYHEMGHCDLDLDHTNHGIMVPSGLREDDYILNREQYLEELFRSR